MCVDGLCVSGRGNGLFDMKFFGNMCYVVMLIS